MEYTKGEWTFYPGAAAPAVIAKIKGQPDKLICHARLFMGSEDMAEAEANARLIAASPRMADLLQRLVTDGWNVSISEEAKEILQTLA